MRCIKFLLALCVPVLSSALDIEAILACKESDLTRYVKSFSTRNINKMSWDALVILNGCELDQKIDYHKSFAAFRVLKVCIQEDFYEKDDMTDILQALQPYLLYQKIVDNPADWYILAQLACSVLEALLIRSVHLHDQVYKLFLGSLQSIVHSCGRLDKIVSIYRAVEHIFYNNVKLPASEQQKELILYMAQHAGFDHVEYLYDGVVEAAQEYRRRVKERLGHGMNEPYFTCLNSDDVP